MEKLFYMNCGKISELFWKSFFCLTTFYCYIVVQSDFNAFSCRFNIMKNKLKIVIFLSAQHLCGSFLID